MSVQELNTATATEEVVVSTKEIEAIAEKTRDAKGKKPRTLASRQAWTGFLFILPWLIGFILFFLTPLITSIQFSFSEIKIEKTGYQAIFVGIQNYYDALQTDTSFPKMLVENVQNLFINVPIILVFSFFVSLLLKQNFRGVNAVKAIFFLPVIMASGLFVSLQSSADATALDAAMSEMETSGVSMLQAANLEGYLIDMGIKEEWIEILITPINNLYSVLTTSGIQIFIFLAGLNSISPSLYEACYIEGASGWETFWKITFPMMVPMILVNTIYSIIDTFTSASNSIMSYVYQLTFEQFEFGLAAAMNWLYFLVLGVVMAVVAFLISRKAFYYT